MEKLTLPIKTKIAAWLSIITGGILGFFLLAEGIRELVGGYEFGIIWWILIYGPLALLFLILTFIPFLISGFFLLKRGGGLGGFL